MVRWTQEVVDQYFADGGDQKFRLDPYDIDEGFIVEIGACDGDYTERLASRFPDATIAALEPIPRLCNAARERLACYPNVSLTNAGLWSSSIAVTMTDDGTGSTVADGGELVKMFDAAFWLKQFSAIDLLVVNIEGGEYEVLPRAIESGVIRIVRDLQVQFHDVADDSPMQMLTIQRALMDTHDATYMYPFCMENWRRR